MPTIPADCATTGAYSSPLVTASGLSQRQMLPVEFGQEIRSLGLHKRP
jgi:hypothetical protein